MNEDELKSRKITELQKRADSYRYQVVVYKGLFDRTLDKILDK